MTDFPLNFYKLKKLRKFQTQKAALLIYKNMILPILEYGDIYMASATKENRKKLQTLQNKALKCALNKEKLYGTREVHAKANIAKLVVRRKIHTLLHFFQLTRNPKFKGWKAKLKINNRSNKKKLMLVKKTNLVLFKKSITYRGPKIWNKLPPERQTINSYFAFKTHLESHFKTLHNQDTNPNVDLDQST